MTAVATVVPRIAAACGAGLSIVFAAAARLRPAEKPLHPRGSVLEASVYRHGLDQPVGVSWLDAPGEDAVMVRVSRALGLPDRLPDIHGLAIRVPLGSSHADLLLATTGSGPVGRFLLRPSLNPRTRSYTTLLPYRTATGPLLLAALPSGSSGVEFRLACASPRGPWRTFARLHVHADEHRVATEGLERIGPDPIISFDPVLNRLPGLRTYAWVESLREGAYAAARRARGRAPARAAA